MRLVSWNCFPVDTIPHACSTNNYSTPYADTRQTVSCSEPATTQRLPFAPIPIPPVAITV